MLSIVSERALENALKQMTTPWSQVAPFPHVVIDGFCREDRVGALKDELADVSVVNKSRDYVFAKNKFEKNRFEELGQNSLDLFTDLTSKDFESFLFELTKERLFVDPDFLGGGLHLGGKGSYLDMHADFNVHPLEPSWLRHLNILLYMNEGWRSDYGGELLLRNAKTDIKASVPPTFNRAVLMLTNDITLHGYDPISFPSDKYRTSIAAYAYRKRSDADDVVETSTRWYPKSGLLRKGLSKVSHHLVRVKNGLLGVGSKRNS